MASVAGVAGTVIGGRVDGEQLTRSSVLARCRVAGVCMKTVFSDMRGLNENSVLSYRGLHENGVLSYRGLHENGVLRYEKSAWRQCSQIWGVCMKTVLSVKRGLNDNSVLRYSGLEKNKNKTVFSDTVVRMKTVFPVTGVWTLHTEMHGSEHSIQSCRGHCRPRYWGLNTVVPSYRGLNTVVPSYRGLNTVVPSYRDLNTVVPSYRGLNTVVTNFRGLNTVVTNCRGLNTVVPSYRGLNTVVPNYRGLNTVVSSYRGLNTVVPSYIQWSEHCSAKLQSLYTHIVHTASLDMKQHWTRIITFRAWEVCENRGGCPGLPDPNSPYGFCGRKAKLNSNSLADSLTKTVSVCRFTRPAASAVSSPIAASVTKYTGLSFKS